MRFAPLLALTLLLAGCTRAQPGSAPLVDAYPGLRFTQPVDIQAPPDGSSRLFVVEQTGRVRVFPTNAGAPAATTFLDLTSLVVSGGELGLLGLAFHPAFAQNGQVFVFYTRRRTSGAPYEEVVARYRVSGGNANVADPASAEVLLAVPDPFSNHNGGQLQFGPDGYLYVTLGDGGSANDPQGNGQNTSALLGKILRLDVDNRTGSTAPECDATGQYRIPADNPFSGPAAGCGEVYAYGLRNVWRFSFGPEGALWAADVGQGAWEEVNKITKGGNYGWNVMEGAHCFRPATGCDTSGKVPPVHEYGHNMDGGFSITGGYIQPSTGGGCSNLGGWYVFGDYVSKHIWALRERAGAAPNVVRIVNGSAGVSVSTFGLDANGRMLIADHSGGRLMAFNCAALPVATETTGQARRSVSLTHAGANPFTATTALRFGVDRPRRVVVAAFDVLGREVARLFDGETAGLQVVQLDGAGLAPGVYAVRAMAEGVSETVRVVRGR